MHGLVKGLAQADSRLQGDCPNVVGGKSTSPVPLWQNMDEEVEVPQDETAMVS